MLEGRAVVEHIEKTRKNIISLDSFFKEAYEFIDAIYVPKAPYRSLDDDVVRIRIPLFPPSDHEGITVLRKQSHWQGIGKQDTILLRERFSTLNEALEFITHSLSDSFTYGFQFQRRGWHYLLHPSEIFLEQIMGYKPTVEIQGESTTTLKTLFRHLGVEEYLSDSVPEIMRKLLLKRS